MKRTLPFVLMTCLGLSGAPALLAAEGPPPKVLRIIREDVKPGKGAAHEKIEAGWPRAFAKVKSSLKYLAMTAASGPTEAWFVEAWDSFAALEQEQKKIEGDAALTAELEQLSAQDGELLTKLSTMLAAYREDLSYRPSFDASKMRFFSVTTFHVKPGHEQDLVAMRKIVNDVHEKLKMDEHWATYQVVSGAPTGTFLLFLPMKTFADMDAAREMHGKAYQDAVGEENQKKLRELASEAILNSEPRLFAFNPKMSYVSDEFAAGDPDYWRPKPAPKPAAKPAAEAKKK